MSFTKIFLLFDPEVKSIINWVVAFIKLIRLLATGCSPQLIQINDMCCSLLKIIIKIRR